MISILTPIVGDTIPLTIYRSWARWGNQDNLGAIMSIGTFTQFIGYGPTDNAFNTFYLTRMNPYPRIPTNIGNWWWQNLIFSRDLLRQPVLITIAEKHISLYLESEI